MRSIEWYTKFNEMMVSKGFTIHNAGMLIAYAGKNIGFIHLPQNDNMVICRVKRIGTATEFYDYDGGFLLFGC